MKNFVKVVKIILLSLLVFVLVGYVVLYIVNNVEAKRIMATVVDYANKPLPIAGVSSTVVAILVWKIFSYSRVGHRTINKVKKENETYQQNLEKKYESDKTEYAAIIGFYEKENDLVYDAVTRICEVTPNKKVKEIGVNLTNDVAKVREEIRSKFNKVSTSEAELLIKSRKEIVESVVEEVKKELVEKYGKESEEIIKPV